MSTNNTKWSNVPNNENQEIQGHRAISEDEDEFGEFEGADHFEPSMAQPLPQALQAGMSAWSTFPDYVPSQHTTSSALQPDLLPMQASMHSSQMTDSSSSLGEAASLFDLPDDGSAVGAIGPVASRTGVVNVGAGSLPDLSPNVDATIPGCVSMQRIGQSFHRRMPQHSVGSVIASLPGLALPDVSSREEVTLPQGRILHPDFRTTVNGNLSPGGQQGHHGGAIPRTRVGTNGSMDTNMELGTSRSSSGSSPVSTLEDQLNAARTLNQRLTSEVEDLQQRVIDLEEQLTQCRSLLQSPNRSESLEVIVQEALQKHQTGFKEEIVAQISRLQRTDAGTALTEERVATLLRENNERQMRVLDTHLEAFLGKIQLAVQDNSANGHSSGQSPAMVSDLGIILEKFAEDQSKREAETRNHLLNCLEAIFSAGQQQLQALRQQPGLQGSS